MTLQPHLCRVRRLFVLEPGLLRWFEDDTPNAALRGEMILDSTTVIETRTEQPGHAHELVVRSTMRTTVQELVLTPSPGDDGSLNEWEAAIQAHAG